MAKLIAEGYTDHLIPATDGLWRSPAVWPAASGITPHLDVGPEPYGISEKYYPAQCPQTMNRIIIISSYVDVGSITKSP